MIGILGGTFDPIHYGHLRPAQEVMRAAGLSELRLVPAGQPPHRPAPVATAAQRLAMVTLACREFPGFVVDECEQRRAGPSYTVDTLESLRAEIGTRSLCLLMGSDAFRGIEGWHAWQRLPELAHLVVMQRPGVVSILPAWAQSRQVQSPAELARQPAGRLWLHAVTPQDVSGTRLRAAIARHEPVQAWLPAAVLEYIQREQLYLDRHH